MPKNVAKQKVVLTDRMLKARPPAPAGKRDMVWDAVVPHLAARVTDKGTISFVVVRRRAGQPKPTFHVLGKYPTVSLADARAKAPAILAALAQGNTPREQERARLKEDARRRKHTFETVAEDFITLHIKASGLGELRGAKEYESRVRRELIPVWGKRPVAEIERSDVIELLDGIKGRGTPYAAHHVFADVRKLFNWALDRDAYGLEINPCVRIDSKKTIGRRKKRKRHLSDDELRLVWKASKLQVSVDAPTKLPEYPFGSLVQVLLLSGQRLRQFANSRWREFDFDKKILVLPNRRMKMDNPHTTPLTPRVIKILGLIPKTGPDGFVFTTTLGKKPFSGFSKAKERLDKSVAALAQREIEPFTVQDLRRTVRTRLSALGASFRVAELIIGHAQTGVEEIYDLYTFDAEKRAALLAWENLLLSIVEPPPGADNVTPLFPVQQNG